MRYLRQRKGQAIVELALLVSFLMLLGAGAIQFGILYGISLRVEHAAREGARWASVHALDGTDTDIKNQAIAAAADLDPPISESGITVATPDGRVGDQPIYVTVVYPYSPRVFLVSALLPKTINFTHTAVMRIEA